MHPMSHAGDALCWIGQSILPLYDAFNHVSVMLALCLLTGRKCKRVLSFAFDDREDCSVCRRIA